MMSISLTKSLAGAVELIFETLTPRASTVTVLYGQDPAATLSARVADPSRSSEASA